MKKNRVCIIAILITLCTYSMCESAESRKQVPDEPNDSIVVAERIWQMIKYRDDEAYVYGQSASSKYVPADSLPYSVGELTGQKGQCVWAVSVPSFLLRYTDRLSPGAYTQKNAKKDFTAVVDPVTGNLLRIDGVSDSASSVWLHRHDIVSIEDHLKQLKATLVGVAADTQLVPLLKALDDAKPAQITMADCVSFFPLIIKRDSTAFPVWIIASYGTLTPYRDPEPVIWTVEINGETGKRTQFVAWWGESAEDPR